MHVYGAVGMSCCLSRGFLSPLAPASGNCLLGWSLWSPAVQLECFRAPASLPEQLDMYLAWDDTEHLAGWLLTWSGPRSSQGFWEPSSCEGPQPTALQGRGREDPASRDPPPTGHLQGPADLVIIAPMVLPQVCPRAPTPAAAMIVPPAAPLPGPPKTSPYS